MKKILFLLILIFIDRTCAQISEKKIHDHDLRDDMRLSLVVITDDRNVVRSGLLVDYYQDSVKIFVNNKETAIHINNIRQIEIMNPSSSHPWTIAGIVGGAYLGHLLLFSPENQKGWYRSSESGNFWPYLLNIVVASVTGVLGYLAEDVNQNKKSFIFAGDVEEEKNNFLDYIVQKRKPGNRINILFEAGSVNTKFEKILSKTQGTYQYVFSDLYGSNFNMLRKLQIHYNINEFLSAGVAFNWITEPEMHWYYYSSNYSSAVYGSQILDGNGYYAAVESKPLVKYLPDVLKISIGAMAGIMNLDYKSSVTGHSNYPDPAPVRMTAISESYLSGGVYAAVGLQLNKVVSISLTGDYLYVPGETTAVPEINLESLPFSTSSIGFSIGFSF